MVIRTIGHEVFSIIQETDEIIITQLDSHRNPFIIYHGQDKITMKDAIKMTNSQFLKRLKLLRAEYPQFDNQNERLVIEFDGFEVVCNITNDTILVDICNESGSIIEVYKANRSELEALRENLTELDFYKLRKFLNK